MRVLILTAAAVIAAGAARAAPETTARIGAVAVVAVTDASGDVASRSAAGLVHGGFETVWTLDSGAQIALVADGRLSLDPARPDGRARGAGGSRIVSPSSRTGPLRDGRTGAAEATGLAIALRTGWGEIAVGRGPGAAILATGDADPAFSALGLDDPLLDPTGLLDAGSANDASGSASKLLVRSPRLIGLELTASYAPRADSGDRARGFGGAGEPELRDLVEVGLSFERRLSIGELTAGLGVLAADMDRTPGGFGRYEALSAAASWRSGPWRIAGRALSADNGRPGDDGRRRVVSAPLSRDVGSWRIEASAAQGSDRLTGQRSRSAGLSLSRPLGDSARIGMLLSQSRRTTDFAGSRRAFGAALELAFTHW